MTSDRMKNDQPSSRDLIFSRIDAALGPSAAHVNPDTDRDKLPRDYIRRDSLTGQSLVDLFEHRITDYGANVFHATPDQILLTIERALVNRGAKRLLVPAGFPADWLPGSCTFTSDNNLSYDALNRFDGVLTTATAAIAATGSIILQHGPGQGRRALSLIPDYHLCIVRNDQLVETVPAAFARLDPLRPTTFISGPSATADIEMTRIKGVHGPRFLDVVLVS